MLFARKDTQHAMPDGVVAVACELRHQQLCCALELKLFGQRFGSACSKDNRAGRGRRSVVAGAPSGRPLVARASGSDRVLEHGRGMGWIVTQSEKSCAVRAGEAGNEG